MLNNDPKAHKQHLAESLWPDNIGHLSAEPVDLKDSLSWQAMPGNFEDLCEWGYLAKNENSTDKKHCHYLLYKMPHDMDEVFVVTVHVQGFIEK